MSRIQEMFNVGLLVVLGKSEEIELTFIYLKQRPVYCNIVKLARSRYYGILVTLFNKSKQHETAV